MLKLSGANINTASVCIIEAEWVRGGLIFGKLVGGSASSKISKSLLAEAVC